MSLNHPLSEEVAINGIFYETYKYYLFYNSQYETKKYLLLMGKNKHSRYPFRVTGGAYKYCDSASSDRNGVTRVVSIVEGLMIAGCDIIKEGKL